MALFIRKKPPKPSKKLKKEIADLIGKKTS